MRLIAPITEAVRLAPAPVQRPAAPALTPEAVRPAARPLRSPLWTLSHETAGAAVAVQMLSAPRRGLKADLAERARYARAYAPLRQPPHGLMEETRA